MSQTIREVLGFTTLACIVWDTVMTAVLLRIAIRTSRRVAALEKRNYVYGQKDIKDKG